MVRKTIEQLRKENARLKSQATGRDSMNRLAEEKRIERNKIIAENRLLRNPGSISAKRNFRKATGVVGRFLKKGALKIHGNLQRAADEERRREKMLELRKKKRSSKPNKRRQTTPRRTKR